MKKSRKQMKILRAEAITKFLRGNKEYASVYTYDEVSGRFVIVTEYGTLQYWVGPEEYNIVSTDDYRTGSIYEALEYMKARAKSEVKKIAK